MRKVKDLVLERLVILKVCQMPSCGELTFGATPLKVTRLLWKILPREQKLHCLICTMEHQGKTEHKWPDSERLIQQEVLSKLQTRANTSRLQRIQRLRRWDSQELMNPIVILLWVSLEHLQQSILTQTVLEH